MKIDFSQMKFESPKKALRIEGDIVSDLIWLFSIEWLLGLDLAPTTKALGLVPLVNRIKKDRIQLVKDRLEGKEKPSSKLENFYRQFDLKKCHEVSRDLIKAHRGYPTGKFDSKGLVYISFKTKNTPYLCYKYSAALFFDFNTKIFISSPESLIFLTKNEKIVAALAPLNPQYIKENKNEK